MILLKYGEIEGKFYFGFPTDLWIFKCQTKNIKLTSRYTLFVIYDDKSHYPSSNKDSVTEKQSYVRRIYIR